MKSVPSAGGIVIKSFSSQRSAITPAGPARFPINLFPERAARGFPENAMPPSRWAAFAAEAAVPEQLVPYVRAVSDLEPLECGGFLAWRSGPALVLVGHDEIGRASCRERVLLLV